MAWIKSAINGNVFEVSDEDLVRTLEAEGHEVHGSDPRIARVRKQSDKK